MSSLVGKFLSTSKDIFINTPRGYARSFNDGAGRALTPGEVVMARSVFGSALDYSQIRISDGLDTESEFGSVSRNHVFLHPGLADKGDLSQSDNLANKRLLIHELTHVWQNQNHIGNVFASLTTGFRSMVLGQNVYAYDLEKNENFIKFNPEQQARLVEDLFFARETEKLYGSGSKINSVPIEDYIAARRMKIAACFPDL